MSPRRVLALIILAALVVLRIEPRLLGVPFDRARLARAYTLFPDRLAPEYPRFLEGVRAHTRSGDTIAVIVPTPDWDAGYSYAYYRASYFLTGREVLPLSDRAGRLQLQNLRQAKYVAAWRTPVPREHYAMVWSGAGGVLLLRR